MIVLLVLVFLVSGGKLGLGLKLSNRVSNSSNSNSNSVIVNSVALRILMYHTNCNHSNS
jgi:hypothetical protein